MIITEEEAPEYIIGAGKKKQMENRGKTGRVGGGGGLKYIDVGLYR